MNTLVSKMLRMTAALLLGLVSMSPAIAGCKSHKEKKIDWEILVDGDADSAFFANDANSGISTNLFGPFVPGSTYWVKGDLYPAGSVNPNTFEVKACKKIGEWYCTGTRVRDIFNPNAPLSQGELFEEANFTYRLNNGDIIFTKQQFFWDSPRIQHVFFSTVKGVKPGDTLTSGEQFFDFTRFILVTGVKKVKD